MPTTHDIKFDGRHAATVTVAQDIELCAIVAMMRRVYDGPGYEIRDEDEISEVTSSIVRMR